MSEQSPARSGIGHKWYETSHHLPLSAEQKEEKMQKAYLYSADYLNSKLSRQGMINARNRFYKSGAFKSKHGTNLAF